MRTMLAMTLLFLLSACGNKGPLYLPPPAQAQAQTQTQVNA